MRHPAPAAVRVPGNGARQSTKPGSAASIARRRMNGSSATRRPGAGPRQAARAECRCAGRGRCGAGLQWRGGWRRECAGSFCRSHSARGRCSTGNCRAARHTSRHLQPSAPAFLQAAGARACGLGCRRGAFLPAWRRRGAFGPPAVCCSLSGGLGLSDPLGLLGGLGFRGPPGLVSSAASSRLASSALASAAPWLPRPAWPRSASASRPRLGGPLGLLGGLGIGGPLGLVSSASSSAALASAARLASSAALASAPAWPRNGPPSRPACA